MRLEIVVVPHAVPAHAQRTEQVQMFPPREEDARPFRSQEPFVAVGGQEIDGRSPHVQRKNAQGLDGVEEQQGPRA